MPPISRTRTAKFLPTNKLTATAAARTPSGQGYWVVLDNGMVFPEGDAQGARPR